MAWNILIFVWGRKQILFHNILQCILGEKVVHSCTSPWWLQKSIFLKKNKKIKKNVVLWAEVAYGKILWKFRVVEFEIYTSSFTLNFSVTRKIVKKKKKETNNQTNLYLANYGNKGSIHVQLCLTLFDFLRACTLKTIGDM